MKSCIARAGIVIATLLGVAPVANAQLDWGEVLFFQPPPDAPAFSNQLLAKTQADECFDGIGVNYPPINPDGSCDVGVPKKNQAYVWGMTRAGVDDNLFIGDEVWFGTAPNPLCQGAAGIFDPQPSLELTWVCEYGESQLARRPFFPLPGIAGDWRLPQVYSYNVESQQLTNRTPRDPLYARLSGVRSAGSLGDAVFTAGPTLQRNVVFSSWDSSSGDYQGSCRATALNNIRAWVTVNGVLYAAVGEKEGGGSILRWNGSIGDPFNGSPPISEYCGFEIVGILPGFPAYITSYNDERLAVSLWSLNRSSETSAPGLQGELFPAGVYLSPLLGADGALTGDDAGTAWDKIWGPADYEPDPVVATTIGAGAIAYWQGYLWFGSFHNTNGTLDAHTTCVFAVCHGPVESDEEGVNLLFNVHRGASIWRARITELGETEVELLYGETELPVLLPGTKTFELQPTGFVPTYGESAFDNPFAIYTWSALATDDRLLFGMYDYRYVFDVRFGLLTDQTPIDPARGYGGDLWRFDAVDSPAQPESLHGMGNFTNYGFRNLMRLDSGPDVFVGTANGLNIAPDGGWELHFLSTLPR